MFQKGDVNGVDEQEHYTYLKSACPPVSESFGDAHARLFWKPLKISDLKWNFEKFLVSPTGQVIMRWNHNVPVAIVRANVIYYMKSLLERDSQLTAETERETP
uniref:glutathione peroxidase n=1 Tax=Callorhinchus milii TaxID=7868 RepID=V9LCU4_CALMI